MAKHSPHANIRGETNFHRPAYEVIACVAWGIAALVYLTIGRMATEGIAIVGYTAIPATFMCLYNGHKVWKNWFFKTQLTTPLPPWMTVDRLLAKQRAAKKMFLGKGFLWEPGHARIMKEVSNLAAAGALDPPLIFRKAMTFLGLTARNVVLEGNHYVHGCGRGEEDLFVTDQSRRSHTLVLGTNGAGKTRMLEAMVAQSIARGQLTKSQARRLELEEKRRVPGEEQDPGKRLARLEPFKPKNGPVFILDPKGDKDLRDRAYATCKRFGQERNFWYFSPTDDKVSFRINPLANYNRMTELANRIAALLPTGGDSEAFRQFAWRAINVVVEGLEFANIPINIATLHKYIVGGIEELAILCIEAHIKQHREHFPTWAADVETIRRRLPGGNKEPPDAAACAGALASYYVNKVRSTHHSATIDGIVDVIEHDAQHYAKLIGNLIPILVQLMSGPMEVLLSNARDSSEARVQTSFQNLIDLNAVVYINFESLADSVVGSALGSLFLADLTACAAVRHHQGKTEPPVAIFVDEAAEMMNDPFIQALNKGRAAGFELTLASQTIADFVAKMGNEAKALQVLGNVNTTIAMRLQDNESIQMVCDKFGETSYEERTSAKSSTTIAAMAHRGRDFSGQVTKNTQTTDLGLVTPDLLSSLPPGHYFGHFPGGRKVKGRVLMMPIDNDDRFSPSRNGHIRQPFQLSKVQVKPDTQADEELLYEEVHFGFSRDTLERYDANQFIVGAA